MDEDYEVELKADTSQYQQSFQGAISTTDALTAALGKLAVGVGHVWTSTNRKLTLFSAGEIAGVTALTMSAARLDQQMSQLNARQKMLGESTRGYTGVVNDLRQSLGASSGDVISLVTQLNRMNVPLSQQQATLKSYAGLAAVTGESIGGLSTGVSQFMRQMGNTGSFQTAERYSSMIAGLSNNFGAGAQSTVDFANSIAPLSKTMGMSAQQITGISAAFSKAGQDGYAASNVYTKILSDVNRAIVYGSPEIAVYSNLLGKTVSQFKAMPTADVITGIFEALQKQGPDAIKTLERLGLEGVRSQRAISSVMQQGGLGTAISTAQTGFSDQGVQKFRAGSQEAMKGFNDQMDKAGQSVKVFGQSIGSVFLPVADKLAGAINLMLAPLRGFSSLIAGDGVLNTGLRTLVAGVTGLLVVAPLLPRIFSLLGTAALGASALRSPATAGLRLGFNPNRELNATQRAFIGGEGRAASRSLFRGGMLAGELLGNVIPGRRGDLSQHAFMEPTGVDMGPRRPWGQILNLNEENRNRIWSAWTELSGPGGDRRRLPERAIGTLGQMARSQLWSLTPSALINPMTAANPDALTQASRWRDTRPGLAFRTLFSQQGVDQSAAQMRMHAEAVRESTGTLKAFSKEGLLTVSSMAKAGAGLAGGVAAGGVRAGVGLGKGLLGGALGLVGGPVGLTVMGGLGLLGLASSEKKANQEMVTGDATDQSAGAAYRDALGEASRATSTFAQVVTDNAKKMSTVGSPADQMKEAMTVGTKDVEAVYGKHGDVVDKNLAKLTAAQAKTYAAQMLPGASAQSVAMLKTDLVSRFGAAQAQQILNSATTPSNTGIFGLLGDQTQTNLGGLFENRLYTTQGTRDMQAVIADTLKTQMNQAVAVGGAKGGAQSTQSILNQFLATNNAAARTGGSEQRGITDQNRNRLNLGAGGSKVTRAQYDAVAQAIGLQANDQASMDAVQRVMDDLAASGPMSAAQREKLVTDSLTKNLAGTDIGSRLAQARELGGVYSGTSYSMASLPGATVETQLGPETVKSMRGGAAGGYFGGANIAGQVATSMGPAGAGVAVQKALENQGNATAQVTAQQQLLGQTLVQTHGSLDDTVHSLQMMKVSITDVNDPMHQIAEATLAAAEAMRSVQNVVSGQTSLNTRIGQATGNVQAAQAALTAHPESPDAAAGLEKARTDAEGLRVEATNRMKDIAMQFRSLDIQRTEGVEAMSRQQGIAEQNYQRQRRYAETDFQIQRGRGEYQYNLQRSQSIEDFHTSQTRQLEAYHRSRRREEEDFNHQVVVMARQTAQSVYNIYERITVQRTWSGTNLVQNLADQQRALQTQEADLAKARRAGLSNAAIQQMGLNESANAQQLNRLVQDIASDPRLIKQFNTAVGRRTSSAKSLMQDPANEQWTEMTRQRRINLNRQAEDFNIGSDQQTKDFAKTLRRSQAAYRLQQEIMLDDFVRMGRRQREEMRIGFEQQREDFDYQMSISKKNISLFSQELEFSFEEAWKIVAANTTGEMHNQTMQLSTLFDNLTKITHDKSSRLYDAINDPYKKLSQYQPFGGKPTDAKGFSTLAGQGHRMAGGVPVGGPENIGDVQRAAGLGIIEGRHNQITQGVSGGHPGVDLAGSEGTPVRAIKGGQVLYSGPAGAYGNLIKLAHGGGMESWYAHLSHLAAKTGQTIASGESLGRVGHTGNVHPSGLAGSHLHFEIRVNGKDIDPASMLGNRSGAGGHGGPTDTPDFGAMPAVKAWNKWMTDLGLSKTIGGDQVIINLAVQAFQRLLNSSGLGAQYTGGKAGMFAGVNLSAEQIASARNIAQVGSTLGVSSRGILVALMTAMQESGLKNLHFGDRDSLGLFQQRSAWGSASQRTNEQEATRMFFQGGHSGQRGLLDIKDWQKMSLGHAAQSVQVSAFPSAYDQWQTMAQAVLSSLAAPGAPGGTGSGSQKHVTWKGGTFTERFLNTLLNAEAILGRALDVFQGGFSHRVAASGTSHLGDAVDAGPAGSSSSAHAVQNALRKAGVAAWVRGPYADTPAGHRFTFSHVHGVPLPGFGYAGGSGVWQAQNFLQGGDGLARGTSNATPGWKMVGEHGYEFVKLKGGEEVRNHAQSKAMVAGGQTVTPRPTIVNNHYDSSTSFDGAEINVQTSDVNAFLRELEARKRMSALTRPKGRT